MGTIQMAAVDSLCDDLKRTREQRDELLEALDEIRHLTHGAGARDLTSRQVNRIACNALAKAKGEA